MKTVTQLNEEILNNLKSGDNSVENAAAWCRMVKERERLQQYEQIWKEQKRRMQENGCAFLSSLEKTNDNYLHGVVTYQNIKCEYWTAAISKGQLTDIMIKGADAFEARKNQLKWESFLN